MKAKLGQAENKIKSLEGSSLAVGQLIEFGSDDEHTLLLGDVDNEGGPQQSPTKEEREEVEETGEKKPAEVVVAEQSTEQQVQPVEKKAPKPEKPKKSKVRWEKWDIHIQSLILFLSHFFSKTCSISSLSLSHFPFVPLLPFLPHLSSFLFDPLLRFAHTSLPSKTPSLSAMVPCTSIHNYVLKYIRYACVMKTLFVFKYNSYRNSYVHTVHTYVLYLLCNSVLVLCKKRGVNTWRGVEYY